MDKEQVDKIMLLLKIIAGQFQYYLEMKAKLDKLPPPTPLPEDWDSLLKEPSMPDEEFPDTP